MSNVVPVRSARKRPGSGVTIDPEKLERLMLARGFDRLSLSVHLEVVCREQDIRRPDGTPVTYTRDAIAKIFNGERKPKPASFQALCVALGCEPDDLRRAPGTPPPADPEESAREAAESLVGSNEPVAALKDLISARSYNSLIGKGEYATVGQVAAAELDGALRKIRMLGHVQQQEIRRALVTLADQAGDDQAEAI